MRLLLEYEAADIWNHLADSHRAKILSGSDHDGKNHQSRIWNELPIRVRYWLWGFLCCRELVKARWNAMSDLVNG